MLLYLGARAAGGCHGAETRLWGHWPRQDPMSVRTWKLTKNCYFEQAQVRSNTVERLWKTKPVQDACLWLETKMFWWFCWQLSVRMIAGHVEIDEMAMHTIITKDLHMPKSMWSSSFLSTTPRQNNKVTNCTQQTKKLEWAGRRPKSCSVSSLTRKDEVHHEFLPNGQPVKGDFYVEVLKRWKGNVNRVRSDIATKWKLHHDNAPSHTC